MRRVAACVIFTVIVLAVGCGDPPESMTNQAPKNGGLHPMPTAVGVTAGQSGTGTTSGY